MPGPRYFYTARSRLSKVKEEQLSIRVRLEDERTQIAAESSKARLEAQLARVEQQKALYQLRRSQVEALHVRAGINGVLQLVPVDKKNINKTGSAYESF